MEGKTTDSESVPPGKVGFGLVLPVDVSDASEGAPERRRVDAQTRERVDPCGHQSFATRLVDHAGFRLHDLHRETPLHGVDGRSSLLDHRRR